MDPEHHMRKPIMAIADHDRTIEAWQHWKKTLLTSEGAGGYLRVRRPNSAGAIINSTVSEGIAYGMLISALMDDQEVFDALWSYSQLHINKNGLMDWYIGPDGTLLGLGGATDSDEDIAYALLLAATRWGKSPRLGESYRSLALKQIDAVWTHEVDISAGYILKSGDRWVPPPIVNPSYFAPAFYRAFAEASGNDGWLKVVDSCYRIIDASLCAVNGNAGNGLVPAWCRPDGTPDFQPRHFQFDSCRTPFRIAQDFLWYADSRAHAYLEKITGFYMGIGLENLIDGFDLDGTPHPEFSVDGSRAAAFVGPAGVAAACLPSCTEFAEAAYRDLVTKDALIVGDSAHVNNGSIYYNTSWRVLSLLMLDGSFSAIR